jgi:hypothetical protein
MNIKKILAIFILISLLPLMVGIMGFCVDEPFPFNITGTNISTLNGMVFMYFVEFTIISFLYVVHLCVKTLTNNYD